MSISVSKLGLAAAQFGLDGMTSSPRGRSPEAEARDILSIADRSRLSVLDVSGDRFSVQFRIRAFIGGSFYLASS